MPAPIAKRRARSVMTRALACAASSMALAKSALILSARKERRGSRGALTRSAMERVSLTRYFSPYQPVKSYLSSTGRATSTAEAQPDPAPPPAMGMSLTGVPTTGNTPPAPSFMGPMSYPLPIYGQYPHIPAVHKPGEASPYHPTYYLPMQPAPGSHPGQEHEGQGYPLPPPHQYYSPYLPYGTVPYPAPYIVSHHRPDMPVVMQPHAQYPGYPNGHHPPYSKPPSAGNPGVDVTVGVNGSARREDHADNREAIAEIEGRSM